MPYVIRHQWSRFVTYQKTPKVFTPEECTKIIDAYGEQKNFRSDMRIAGQQYRDTDVRWIRGEDKTAHWIFERLERSVLKWNANNFNFEVDMCSDLQLACYKPGQFYEWHVDLGGRGYSRRKISTVVMLSPPADYEGGRLQFFESDDRHRSFDLDAGDIVNFTSWLKHRVTPVEKGIRWTIAAWWIGRPFR